MEPRTPEVGSPFLTVPASEWLAANNSAFAIAHRFPVSPGHALVVPRRAIATWWEATNEERADILALVDEVKRRADADLRPDGYNVGLNAGSAAGQTIEHLHIHVILRYRGDVPDPRGGVRNVIPSRGNYLRAPDEPTHWSTGRSDCFAMTCCGACVTHGSTA
jgi:diadenosine tetraphosphate (Ap4A) HIT family hydrolase